MNHILTVTFEEKPAYDIRIESDYHQLPDALSKIDMMGRKFMIISDSNVSKYYLNDCMQLLQPIAKSVTSYIFPAGESSKTLETVNNCYEQLIQANFDRNDVLIALGGGVVGDLTGFVAATYLRGVRFIQLPTSLLSMVDSSIGGKTGVDFKSYKNMVGAFHQPKLVYMNLTTLSTLKNTEFYSGMSEIIKHGLIKDLAYYTWLKEQAALIIDKNYEVLSEMILRSCEIKREVVEMDPKEKGERALLNFGHTIGHSVEKLMDFSLLHGECVSVGIAAASYISMKRNNITHKEYTDILDTLTKYMQPIQVKGLTSEEVYAITRLDKKMDNDKIKFILLQEIGVAKIDTSVSKEELIEAIHTVLI